MDFYFTDRQYNLLGIASTERGRFRIGGEIEAQSTTASTVALTGNVYFAKDDLSDAIAMVVGEGGNYILYQDDRGVGHFMTIQDTQVDNTGCSINFQADDAGNDLKNEIVGTYKATKSMTFAQYFAMFCADSGWELGLNEIPSNVRTLEFTSEQTSYDRMLEVAKDFGVSIYYTFEINGIEPVHRYLNVVNKLGSTTNITLRQGTDISQIVSETSTADLHTSIKAYGATPDGKTAPLNLAGYKWTDSTGQFALGGDGVLRDTIAIRTWSRLRSNTNPTPEYSHLQMVKTYDATTQATLLQSALADLKQYNHPAVNYTVTMARVPSELSKGDTVNVEDEAQNLYLSATVLEVDKCYSMPSSSTLTLGDFKIEHDQTSARIKQMAQEISQIPAGKPGVGIAATAVTYQASTSGTTAPTGTWVTTPPTVAAGSFLWTRMVWAYTDGTSETGYSVAKAGEKGDQGIPGPKGIDGKTQYTHIAYANIEFLCREGSDFTLSEVSLIRFGSDSRWVYKEFQAGTYTAETTLWGQGDPAVGTVKNAELVSEFSTSDSASKTHIGVYVDFVEADSVDPSKYNWTLIKGADGANGTPGKAGADGKTPYFHIAYADSPDGKDGFYVGGGTNLLINTSSSSANGQTVLQGATTQIFGVYSRTDSYEQVAAPSSGEFFYRFVVPDQSNLYGLTPGETYTLSGSASHTVGELIFRAQYGVNGTNWDYSHDDISDLGIPVSNGLVFTPFSYTFTIPAGATGVYFSLQNDDFTSGSLFRFKNMKLEKGSVATPWSPNPAEAHPIYMGTYTDYTQADSLDPATYLWSQIKGADGNDGVPGKDGLGIKSTAIAYQLSSSGTATPTGTWSTTVPTLTKGQYLWTRTTLTYTDNSSEPVYSVSYVAKDGNDGSNGVAGKDGVGIKSTTITYATSTSGTSAPTSGWVSTPPTATAGQFIWTRTIWTYTDNTTETGYSVGKIGENGDPGNGVKSSLVSYQVGTSGTTAPTGNWTTTVPNASQGTYLWSRIVTTYTDGTQNTAYSVAYQAKDGAKGDPGSQDVPMTYVQTDQPAGTIVKDSLWWVGTAMNNVTALKRWNGSDWVPDTIAQAVLNIIELNAVTINAAVLNSPLIKVPFEHMVIDSENTLGSGTMTLDGPKLTLDGTIDGGTQKFQVQLAGDGFSSIITDTDGDLNNPMKRAAITKGELDLSYAYGGSGQNKTYINSVFDAGGAARYLKSVDLAATANFSSAHISYMRQGAVCAVAFNVVLTSDVGWVGLSAVPPGYTPASNYVAANLPSISYQGQSCALYYNSQGWRLIPTSGQGHGGFQGVISYTTNDDYPYEDATL